MALTSRYTPKPFGEAPGAMSGVPDVNAMERNLANKMRMRRPQGWSRGKAAWKQNGGLPPGFSKRLPRPRTGMKPPPGQVTNNV